MQPVLTYKSPPSPSTPVSQVKEKDEEKEETKEKRCADRVGVTPCYQEGENVWRGRVRE